MDIDMDIWGEASWLAGKYIMKCWAKSPGLKGFRLTNPLLTPPLVHFFNSVLFFFGPSPGRCTPVVHIIKKESNVNYSQRYNLVAYSTFTFPLLLLCRLCGPSYPIASKSETCTPAEHIISYKVSILSAVWTFSLNSATRPPIQTFHCSLSTWEIGRQGWLTYFQLG